MSGRDAHTHIHTPPHTHAHTHTHPHIHTQTHPELLPTDLSTHPLTSGTCRFMNGTNRDIVGLVSFPGSGNTWVRGLIQTVTGICTGI